jgi:hypothetical protein
MVGPAVGISPAEEHGTECVKIKCTLKPVYFIETIYY